MKNKNGKSLAVGNFDYQTFINNILLSESYTMRHNTRKSMIEGIVALHVGEEGFNPEDIQTQSFYELEEKLSIDHYKLATTHPKRVGYVARHTNSRKKRRETLKYLAEI